MEAVSGSLGLRARGALTSGPCSTGCPQACRLAPGSSGAIAGPAYTTHRGVLRRASAASRTRDSVSEGTTSGA
jgi:hypothetical protein